MRFAWLLLSYQEKEKRKLYEKERIHIQVVRLCSQRVILGRRTNQRRGFEQPGVAFGLVTSFSFAKGEERGAIEWKIRTIQSPISIK